MLFSQLFLKGFDKIVCDVPFYGVVKNLIIYFTEAFRCFSHYQFIILLACCYEMFGAAFQLIHV